MLMGSHVPMFKLRPYRSMLIAAVFCGVIGGLISAYFLMEDANNQEASRGLLSVIVTVTLVLVLLIAAFSRYVFPHLHHRRPGYKRG